jgi:hypothetical protein
MEYNCNQCKKKYSSQQSLCNHNKKFHSKNNETKLDIDEQNINKCNFCNKKFINRYTLKNHLLNNCYIKKYNDNNNSNNNSNSNNDNNDCEKLKLQLKIAEIEKEKAKEEKEKAKEEKEKAKEEKEILKLRLKLKTISNITNNNSIKNINSQLNSNNTNINNNFKIISIGRENLEEILSLIDKKTISTNCSKQLVDIVHCGKYDQFKNIMITNLKDEYAYKYSNELNKFICIKKNEVIRDLVSERLENIREIYEELSETSKINDSTKKLIKEFLDKMTNEEKYTEDTENTTYKNFRTYKEHKVKILIYNNLDKISKNLAIILDKPFNN